MDARLSSLLLFGKQCREDGIGVGCPCESFDEFGGGIEEDVSAEGQCVTLCYCILHGYIEIDGKGLRRKILSADLAKKIERPIIHERRTMIGL